MPSNDNDFVDPTKAVLQPRNPGEQLKIKETVLKRRDRNLQAKRRNADKIQAERAKKQEALKTEKLVTPAKLIKRSLTRKKDKNRMKRLNKGPQKHLRVDNAKNGKVIVAIRNKRTSPMPKVESVLKKLRLTVGRAMWWLWVLGDFSGRLFLFSTGSSRVMLERSLCNGFFSEKTL